MRVEQTAYVKEMRVDASPATIFELLTDPDAYPRWMGFAAEFDPRPGGTFRLDLGAVFARGEFIEIVPERRVVFTWGWEGDLVPLAPGASTVEFTLEPDGDGTIVRMRHAPLTPALRDFHAWGWDRYLPRLMLVAEGRDPGEDPMTAPPMDEITALLDRAREP